MDRESFLVIGLKRSMPFEGATADREVEGGVENMVVGERKEVWDRWSAYDFGCVGVCCNLLPTYCQGRRRAGCGGLALANGGRGRREGKIRFMKERGCSRGFLKRAERENQ